MGHNNYWVVWSSSPEGCNIPALGVSPGRTECDTTIGGDIGRPVHDTTDTADSTRPKLQVVCVRVRVRVRVVSSMRAWPPGSD